jgi:PAS domain S-box-containing protein
LNPFKDLGARAHRNAFIRRATVGYALFALAWIFFSDQLLATLADVNSMAWLSTVKGGIFVAVTAALLYFFLYTVPDREERQPPASLLDTMAAPPPASRWHLLLLYGFALGITLATVFLRTQVSPGFSERPFLILFMLPIIFSALLGGLGPGLLSTATAALGVNYFLVPPAGTLKMMEAHYLLQWSFLLASGLLVSFLSEGLRRARTRAEAQHRLLDAIVSGSQDAIFIKDLQGKYLLCNEGMGRFFGKPPEGIVGNDDRNLFPPETVGTLRLQDRTIMDTGQNVTREETLTTLSGRTITFLTHKGPILDQDGRIVGLFGIARDITERKRAEEEIQRLNAHLESQVRKRTAELEQSNEALLRSNQELQHFAHVAAHDLQTPLRSIAGFAQLLQRDTRGKLDKPCEEWLVYIIDNTKRLQSLILELLAYSRLEAHARPFEAVELQKLFGEVAATLAVLIDETGAELSCGPLPTLSVERTQIAQLLQNLIENGIKYNTAKPPRVSVSSERRGKEWVFSVADNGIGIDPKYHGRVFEIFRRLHTYDNIPGTGIGLAICRRIVERHGGRIWVESQPGSGSTFFFTLPA